MTPLLPAQTLSGVDRIHHMDALRLLRSLAAGSVDLIVTSPPYDNLRTYNGYTFPFEAIAHESYRVLKEGGALVWVVGDATVNGSETLTSFRQALYFKDAVGFRMHDTMIWRKMGTDPPHKLIRYASVFEYMFVLTKGEPTTTRIDTFPRIDKQKKRSRRRPDGTLRRDISGTGGGAFPNVWETAVGAMNRDDTMDHPAPFPEELAERHILTWSNPGDTVLDYFGGSGTTAKMARNNGRHYITGDISAEYVDLMRKRLAQPFTLPMFAASA